LRVFVEPADVELDDDDGLLWTSLQTAFPGCSGMYYRERGADCRSAVKFDGKKFLPPAGSWNDRQYYVAISMFIMSSIHWKY
uniref:TDP43_N domain-containing protein n=1 Tax=Haemonchus placei TaxID=6290 RepID=A0A0N4X1M7_HAEPC